MPPFGTAFPTPGPIGSICGGEGGAGGMDEEIGGVGCCSSLSDAPLMSIEHDMDCICDSGNTGAFTRALVSAELGIRTPSSGAISMRVGSVGSPGEP